MLPDHRQEVLESMKMSDSTYIISRNSDMYPARFEGLSNMPEELYVMGSLPDENAPAVAIVGARMCSRYGHNTAFTFGKKLAEHGVSVISGMALGIDGAAQEGALSGGGKTYAVLGCGVDVCYPRSNKMLYDRIPERGGILSEFPPGTQPLPYNFPLRNRLISALADVVIVVEARKKSGSLITVDYALEQGRSVYAVPGRVGDALSDGCNYLIA
ncbi:MAG TPA: DNA-protecting protein DprA, partial [Lachnospiraceae bacterium]|nr:DNA-protecting protein DprA [Lachnospiraceae bacterium]